MPASIPAQRTDPDTFEDGRRAERAEILAELDRVRGYFIHLGDSDPYSHGEIGGLYRAIELVRRREEGLPAPTAPEGDHERRTRRLGAQESPLRAP